MSEQELSKTTSGAEVVGSEIDDINNAFREWANIYPDPIPGTRIPEHYKEDYTSRHNIDEFPLGPLDGRP